MGGGDVTATITLLGQRLNSVLAEAEMAKEKVRMLEGIVRSLNSELEEKKRLLRSFTGGGASSGAGNAGGASAAGLEGLSLEAQQALQAASQSENPLGVLKSLAEQSMSENGRLKRDMRTLANDLTASQERIGKLQEMQKELQQQLQMRDRELQQAAALASVAATLPVVEEEEALGSRGASSFSAGVGAAGARVAAAGSSASAAASAVPAHQSFGLSSTEVEAMWGGEADSTAHTGTEAGLGSLGGGSFQLEGAAATASKSTVGATSQNSASKGKALGSARGQDREEESSSDDGSSSSGSGSDEDDDEERYIPKSSSNAYQEEEEEEEEGGQGEVNPFKQ